MSEQSPVNSRRRPRTPAPASRAKLADISGRWSQLIASNLGILLLLALAKLALHLLTNGQYGFHRDELGMLNDALHLAWGYVSYPPLTPFVARLALELFGTSLVGLRLFAALTQSVVMVLAGLMAGELGGSRRAQIVAAVAVAIAPISLAWSALFHYSGFDFLWWVLSAYLVVRLLNTEDPRYWLAIGAVVGLGMMTKYTMTFCIAGIVTGVLCTPARRYLAGPWLWAGTALALLIFLPNLIWQAQHDFVHFQFLRFIHARDMGIGRTNRFLVEQLYLAAHVVTVPLWLAGLYFYFGTAAGRRYRMLGWMATVPFLLLLVAHGRGYYSSAIYPILIPAGAVYGERWLASLPRDHARFVLDTTRYSLAIGGLIAAALTLPLAPVNSAWWAIASSIDPERKEELGWPELVETVAGIYDHLPAPDRGQAGILANYSEAGAINLFGPAYGLPHAIGGENSDWLRGYGEPPPEVVIFVGWRRSEVNPFFASCLLAGHVTNRYGVMNEDARDRPDIFVCRGLRESWPAFWGQIQSFG